MSDVDEARAALTNLWLDAEERDDPLFFAMVDNLIAAVRVETLDKERLLGTATDEDVMYDYPVAQSGEPIDPVLFIRWDFIRARLAEAER